MRLLYAGCVILGKAQEREAGTFWRCEDLWLSPFGDVGHAFKLPAGVAGSAPSQQFQFTAWCGFKFNPESF